MVEVEGGGPGRPVEGRGVVEVVVDGAEAGDREPLRVVDPLRVDQVVEGHLQVRQLPRGNGP